MIKRRWQGSELLESRVLLSGHTVEIDTPYIEGEDVGIVDLSTGWMLPVVESAQPALASLPGSDYTIFLDFDGHTTQNTSWNSTYNNNNPIVSPHRGYSDALIMAIWERVSEDFKPFNINVTTIEPPAQALIGKGVRVVVTGDQSWLQDNVGYSVGGVAFIGSFLWSSDTPVFVFNGGEVAAADTISHEAGHALGLSHSGTGTLNPDNTISNYQSYYYGHGSGPTGWAPIMGAGFAQQLSQWSQGEYPNAYPSINNTSSADQINTILTRNGFGYRPDIENGVELSFSQTNTGIITTRTDVDTFTFTVGPGTITLDIKPFYRGPNLDILATLKKSDGTIVVSSNPIDQLYAYINTYLTGGTYTLEIDGIGKTAITGDAGYTDYGSIGEYNIVASFVPKQTATVIDVKYGHGNKWVDSEQLAGRTVSWNIDTIALVFDKDVPISIDDLTITGLYRGRLSFSSFTYDSVTHTAIWTLSFGSYQDRLDIDYLDRYSTNLDVLFGDVDGNGTVNIIDALLQRGRNGTDDIWADIDENGIVDLTDAFLLRSRNGQSL